jgi:hypothetical protein
MPLQKLSVRFPEPIQFPEGVDGLVFLFSWKQRKCIKTHWGIAPGIGEKIAGIRILQEMA